MLNPADVDRISTHLGLPPITFVRPIPLTPENQDYTPYSFSLGGTDRFLLALKKRGKRCIFLLTFLQEERCGIHSARPNVCRCYPFSFERGHAKKVRQMLCPKDWELSKNDEKQFAEPYTHLKKDSFMFQAFLDSWHSEVLPQFLSIKKRNPSAKAIFAYFLSFLLSELKKT